MGKSEALAGRPAVEKCFLKFAFPCTHVLFQRGEVDAKTLRKLEKAAFEGGPAVGRRLLENVYRRAFGRMKKVAREMGEKDCWSEKVVRAYFVERHNRFIDAGEGNYAHAPKALREFCKVLEAEVVDVRQGLLIVEYPAGAKRPKRRVVRPLFKQKIGVGGRVRIHHGYAVEIVGAGRPARKTRTAMPAARKIAPKTWNGVTAAPE